MLYTANVDRVLFWCVIPILFFAFGVFKLVESQSITDGGRLSIINQHRTNLTDSGTINCVILGGSNALFGLSAEQMSSKPGFNCYNLSLLNEGYSFPAYWDFVESLPFDRNNISNIFYSGILPIQDDKHYYAKVKNAELGIGVSGDQEFTLLGRSLASYLKMAFKGEYLFDKSHNFPLPNMHGDFDFSKFKKCDYDRSVSEFDRFYWNDIEVLSGWMNSQLSQMKSLFPNSDLFFLVPSVLSRNEPLFANKRALEAAGSAVSSFDNSPNKAVFIIQPMYRETYFLCDAPHHANQAGREMRTRHLVDSL